MIMKAAVIVMFAAIAVFPCMAASAGSAEAAGSVEVGLVDESRVAQWMAGGPADFPSGETACTPAKFEQSSQCGTVVISNNSAHPITIHFASDDNEDFSVGVHRLWGSSDVPQPCYQFRSLQPGGRCYVPVEYWPRTGEA